MPPDSSTPRPRLWPEDSRLALLAHPLRALPPPTPEAERAARMGLAAIWEPGDQRISEVVAEYGGGRVWEFLRSGAADSGLARRAQATDLDTLAHQTEVLKLRFIIPGDPEWPDGLAELDRDDAGNLGGAPVGLWLAGPGDLAALTAKSVAIIGSRAATAYGEHVAADLAAGLAERGVTVVSGGAYGIDAAAHRACLGAGGPTVAFMAGGLSQVYPPGNARLLERVRESYLLVSEHPPDRTPSRPRFLARNRLIAAVTPATVIVEGGMRSGAANTVRWALALGRPVMAVPGPVTSAMSWTPHRLLRDGEAMLVTSPEDVIAALGPFDPAAEAAYPRVAGRLDELPAEDRVVYEELPARSQVAADELAWRTGLPIVDVLTSLGRLREAGLADQTDRGGWRIVRAQERAAQVAA
jgi:DNA processing protein